MNVIGNFEAVVTQFEIVSNFCNPIPFIPLPLKGEGEGFGEEGLRPS